jgi:hypothetical protein
VRAECLDWLLVVDRRHLEHVLRVYVEHYNRHRVNRALQLQGRTATGLTIVMTRCLLVTATIDFWHPTGPGGSAQGPAAKAGKDIISETAQSVADKGWKYLDSKMSPKMRALLKRKPFLNRRAAGLVVHDETAKILEQKFGKRFKYQRSSEVDFVDYTSGGQEIELSTTAGKARHWAYQRFWHPNVQYATYDPPSDIP